MQDVYDYFSGCVPAYCVFHMNLTGILELLRVPYKEYDSTVEEFALIGVVAYTEAFFKDHFASIVNIFPEKIALLKKGNRDVTIDLTDLLEIEGPLLSKFGFLLGERGERFKFGTPKQVNAIYHDLLPVTPFSGDEAVEYDEFINRRNLLVHHGGIATSRYCKGVHGNSGARPFQDSVPITKEFVGRAAILANKVASKTVRATISHLSGEVSGVDPSDIRRRAVNLMGDFLGQSEELEANFNRVCLVYLPEAGNAGLAGQ
jgi:hypothetical protein